MTEEYHRSMVFSIHRFIMRLLTIPIFRYKNTLLTVLFSKEGTYHLVLLRNLPFPTEAPFYSIG